MSNVNNLSSHFTVEVLKFQTLLLRNNLGLAVDDRRHGETVEMKTTRKNRAKENHHLLYSISTQDSPRSFFLPASVLPVVARVINYRIQPEVGNAINLLS